MHFEETTIPGVFEVHFEPATDERGFFARTWCAREFVDHGLPEQMVQASVSQNTLKGTLRGLHFQWPPSREGKLVRCERGAIYDVVLDLRPDSPTFLAHIGLGLDQGKGNAVYIPPGLAHGFQTLEDDSRVCYMMTDTYAPDLAGGFRWNDPAFGIEWPLPVTIISKRDQAYPDFTQTDYAARFRQAK